MDPRTNKITTWGFSSLCIFGALGRYRLRGALGCTEFCWLTAVFLVCMLELGGAGEASLLVTGCRVFLLRPSRP